ncbi:MAG: ParB N-terminal domain-containing protein [Chlorogloeopsis fritschii C42_A2020_084]|uniref:ParB/RepB/Spo0J family partition protein n=1 Tax=Chlorogloeopsis fritschii TaxID=1124 RepID=UPI0019FFF4E8|nr:ParB N-terminal domain-containing protein [Chlorogloeopsis fritschii]MBF2004887.1 ParB N-terminal domain-containing protein [Chlorogloeopsis fritschii C42_A2020_084]
MPFIDINRVNILPNRRPLNDQKVAELMESIKANGLLNPITLDQNLNLVAGLHRLTACKLIGLNEIECCIITCEDKDHARLAEIDENLIRSELDALERSELWLERDRILERMGLRAKVGDNQFTQRGGEILSPPPKTTLELAQEIGYTERTLQYGKQIAKNIVPEVKEMIKGTPIAKSTSALLKIARAGGKELQEAEQAEIAAQEARAKQKRDELEKQKKLAAQAREKHKQLQLVAFQNAIAQKEAKESSKPTQRVSKNIKTDEIQIQTDEVWILDRHMIYCGDTTDEDFIQLLPSNAALAIAPPSCSWNHDYLVNEARVVAVMCREGSIYNLCRSTQMPFRYELVIGNIYTAIFSQETLLKPTHNFDIEGVEGIVSYLVSFFTKPGSFVIIPSIGHGEALIACERLRRICFAGDEDPKRVNEAILRWQRWTGKQAMRA